jgi:hypothetical protein
MKFLYFKQYNFDRTKNCEIEIKNYKKIIFRFRILNFEYINSSLKYLTSKKFNAILEAKTGLIKLASMFNCLAGNTNTQQVLAAVQNKNISRSSTSVILSRRIEYQCFNQKLQLIYIQHQ